MDEIIHQNGIELNYSKMHGKLAFVRIHEIVYGKIQKPCAVVLQ